MEWLKVRGEGKEKGLDGRKERKGESREIMEVGKGRAGQI